MQKLAHWPKGLFAAGPGGRAGPGALLRAAGALGDDGAAKLPHQRVHQRLERRAVQQRPAGPAHPHLLLLPLYLRRQ